MSTVLLVSAGLFALLLLLLAVPVSLAFEAAGLDGARARLSGAWLFGLVRWRVQWPRASGAKQAPTSPKPRRSARRAGAPSRAGALLRNAGFRERLWRLLAELPRTVQTEALRLRLRLGLGDPADTGRLWALLGPLDVMARRLSAADVRLEPDFLEPALEVEASARLRLVPLRVLGVALGFLVSPTVLRALWSLGQRDE